MNSRKFVLHIITGLSTGGAEMMLLKVLQNTRDAPYSQCVVSMRGAGDIGDKIEMLGIKVYKLNMNGILKSGIGFLKFLYIIFRVSPTIVQGWMYHANIMALFAKIVRMPTPVLFNIRHGLSCLTNEKATTRIIIKLNAYFSRFPHFIINNSNRSIMEHESIGFCKKKSKYIGNGFDEKIFRPNKDAYLKFRRNNNLLDNVKVVANFSRYHPVKNHLGLLDIFYLIKNQSTQPVAFLIAGRGVNNQVILDKIKQLELQAECFVLDEIQVSDLLPVCDLYVSSSWGEGFPNVLGEALMCGIPSVSTDVGDSADILGKYGSVSSVGDYEGLAKSCIDWLENKEVFPNMIRDYAIERYSIKNIANDYRVIYCEI